MITDADNLTKLTINPFEEKVLLMCESKEDVTSWEAWIKKKEDSTFIKVETEVITIATPLRFLQQYMYNLERDTTYEIYVKPVDGATVGFVSNTVEFDTFPDSKFYGQNPIAYIKGGKRFVAGKRDPV